MLLFQWCNWCFNSSKPTNQQQQPLQNSLLTTMWLHPPIPSPHTTFPWEPLVNPSSFFKQKMLWTRVMLLLFTEHKAYALCNSSTISISGLTWFFSSSLDMVLAAIYYKLRSPCPVPTPLPWPYVTSLCFYLLFTHKLIKDCTLWALVSVLLWFLNTWRVS